MRKKGINIITTAILSCTIAFTSLPVQAQEVYLQIDGYENYNGTYYKLGEQGWQICDDFYMNQTEYYLEVGEYFSIPWQVSDNKNTTCGRDHTLTYSNSNPSVCNVTPDGMLTALSTGLSDITIVCGDGLAVVTIKVHVTATKRSKTAKYKSIVKSINNIYKKYGQSGAITGKNYKTAWKEILAIDKKVKNYSQYVDTFYGQDADVKNRKCEPTDLFKR